MTKDEEVLAREVSRILEENKINPLLDCTSCGGELTLRMEVLPGDPPKVTSVAYNCEYCLAMNVVWKSPELMK